ncbi:LADA_0B04588g1_1 [Lachancea dasiensis]|uniref:LADA_0B04588g1_1 n=1 Tax=Lachancea dasiensis TaxID=1072105 RepID=A0A1G4IT18_9SACH|nr:LADA_0B04588g1_1 [Lachancea dasiensis]
MCILLASTSHPKYSLIVVSNRDECYSRETRHTTLSGDGFVLCPVDMAPGIDGSPKGGTWLGVNKNGRISSVLNLRNDRQLLANPRNGPEFSRGSVPMRFLNSRNSFNEWDNYDKFERQFPLIKGGDLNLFIGDCIQQRYVAMDSFGLSVPVLTPSNPFLVLSNDFINTGTKWPKVEKAENMLRKMISESEDASEEELVAKCLHIASLCDDISPASLNLKTVALTNNNIFIKPARIGSSSNSVNVKDALPKGRFYGTRSQIVVLVTRDTRRLTFVEQILHDSDDDAAIFSPTKPKNKLRFSMDLTESL